MNPTGLPAADRIYQLVKSNPSKATNIVSQLKGNVFQIAFNRPKRVNAFTSDMYLSLAELIELANETEEVKYIVVTGKGGNFSSGNDLANFANPAFFQVASPKEMIEYSGKMLEKLCKTMIDSKKPLFAVVEGKCIGFAFTQLALYDRVFAVESAEFFAPLVRIAQGPQMCASYTFPSIFGNRGYDDLIVKGKKVNAAFLQKYNFLQSHPSVEAAQNALKSHLADLDALDWNSYINARKLRVDSYRRLLHLTNKRQISNLIQRWSNPDLPAYLKKYMQGTKQKPKL